MNKFIVLLWLLYSGCCIAQPVLKKDSIQLRNIYTTALVEGQSYTYIDYLSNQIGSRISGSLQEKRTVEWGVKTLKSIGATAVRKEPVTVPKWTRGVTEFAYIESQAGTTTNVPICALVGSVATPLGGIKAEVIRVNSIQGLREIGSAAITGKIVFFNAVMDAHQIDPFEAHKAIETLYNYGAKEAAKFGAVGVIIRTANLVLDDIPHTGVVRYEDTPNTDKIPVAALSTNGADLLSGMLALDQKTRFFFNMNCKNWKAVSSFNVIGELKGSETPNQYITIAATLDSWDIGDGSQSDGAALAQAIESIRILKAIGYAPKHTIRIVLLADGVQSQQGFKAYNQSITSKKEKQLLFLYNNTGGFTPRAFGVTAKDAFKKQLQGWFDSFQSYPIDGFTTNTSVLKFDTECPMVRLKTDPQRYFEICRSSLDTFKAINTREVALGAAAMTSVLYLMDNN